MIDALGVFASSGEGAGDVLLPALTRGVDREVGRVEEQGAGGEREPRLEARIMFSAVLIPKPDERVSKLMCHDTGLVRSLQEHHGGDGFDVEFAFLSVAVRVRAVGDGASDVRVQDNDDGRVVLAAALSQEPCG